MYLTEENLISSLTSFINEHYYADTLNKKNIRWIYENEYLPSLFELYVENNYYVERLSEANIIWIYENKFYPMIDNVLYEEDIPERKITSRTGPVDDRIKNALVKAKEETPEVKSMELTSKGNPEDFNARQNLPANKGVIDAIKQSWRKGIKDVIFPGPEAPRYKNGKSAGQGAPFHDDGRAADVAITPNEPRKSDYAAAKFASAAQSKLIKQAKNKDDSPVIGFAVKPGEPSTPGHLSDTGYMKQPKNTPPGVQSIHIGYDNPGKPGTKHRDIRDRYAGSSNVYGPDRMVDPNSGTFARYQQQRTDAELGNLFKNSADKAKVQAPNKSLPPLPERNLRPVELKPKSKDSRHSRPSSVSRRTSRPSKPSRPSGGDWKNFVFGKQDSA